MIEVLEAHTEWVERDGKRYLEWTCPDCDVVMRRERRHATIRCRSCDKIMQASNYSVDARNPDPENPEWFLEMIAKRRGMSVRELLGEEYNDPLSW